MSDRPPASGAEALDEDELETVSLRRLRNLWVRLGPSVTASDVLAVIGWVEFAAGMFQAEIEGRLSEEELADGVRTLWDAVE